MKKVLIVTYFWPPSGKATVHWPLHIAEHLPEFGWQPHILTAKLDAFSHTDESLLKEINGNVKTVRTESWDPFNFYLKFIGKKKEDNLSASDTISKTNRSITHRISIWIRMNLFIPDARAGWYFPGTKGGMKLLEKEKIDAIVSVGPPHTGHLIAKKLSKKFGIPPVPVFIDPWVDIVYYRGFKRSGPTLRIDNGFEKSVLKNAASAVFVTSAMKEDYIKKYGFLKDKSHVLYWGYNEASFINLSPSVNNDELVIVHAGNIFDYQNIPAFWEKIKSEISNGRKIRIKFVGTVSPGIKNAIKAAGLEDAAEYLGFLPYGKMLTELQKAGCLLVCATEKRHVPGKLFEYLRIGKPIIAFGDDNKEVKGIINSANAGMLFGYNEDGREFFEKIETFHTDLSYVKKFDREKIAGELSRILDGTLPSLPKGSS